MLSLQFNSSSSTRTGSGLQAAAAEAMHRTHTTETLSETIDRSISSTFSGSSSGRAASQVPCGQQQLLWLTSTLARQAAG
jgi:uncharacterized protein with gpF-like domain